VIESIEQFIGAIREGSSDWHPEEPRWFRGEPSCTTPLMPSLYRGASRNRENELLQMFRARASGYSDSVPNRDHTDQWLFLAQHVGLPTRLLDWSEGALIALHFALNAEKPIVWMLNPLELNDLSMTAPRDTNRPREFPLPWFCPEHVHNPAFENIAGAWEQDRRGVHLPIAVYPNYVHPRLRGQRACFTVHGIRKEGLGVMVTQSNILQRYDIHPASRKSIRRELQLLGIAESVLFPDLVGLAEELRKRLS
jgi:hypothetical protein